jgi:hypothetical protein
MRLRVHTEAGKGLDCANHSPRTGKSGAADDDKDENLHIAVEEIDGFGESGRDVQLACHWDRD